MVVDHALGNLVPDLAGDLEELIERLNFRLIGELDGDFFLECLPEVLDGVEIRRCGWPVVDVLEKLVGEVLLVGTNVTASTIVLEQVIVLETALDDARATEHVDVALGVHALLGLRFISLLLFLDPHQRALVMFSYEKNVVKHWIWTKPWTFQQT